MKKYDLIVVGAGILGTFHAFHAAKSGKKVLILEKDNYPIGSTVQNFGQAVPSGLAGKWFDLGRRSLSIYKEIQQESDISVRQNGSIYIASDDDELQLVNELYDIHQNQHYNCLLLSQKGVLERYPELQYKYVKGAIYYPEEVSVEPNLLIYKLIQLIKEKYHVDYLPNTVAIDCVENSEGVRLFTANQEVFNANKVIICSGYNFNLIFPEIFASSGLIVSKLQMMQTKPMKEITLKGNILTGLTIRRYESFTECPSFNTIETPEHLVELKKWGIHVLFKQAIDGSIIIGDSHEYAPVNQTDDLGLDSKNFIDELVLQEAERIVNFSVRNIARTWAGRYAQHSDDIFEYNVSSNIHIRTGIGGKGMTSSAGYAEAAIRELF